VEDCACHVVVLRYLILCDSHGAHVMTITAAIGVSTVNYFEYCGVK
jgi:hypothetical protein